MLAVLVKMAELVDAIFASIDTHIKITTKLQNSHHLGSCEV